VTVERPDQVWCTDIPMHRGWICLAAIMDWFSRHVLAREVSVARDSSFYVSAPQRALAFGTLEIFK